MMRKNVVLSFLLLGSIVLCAADPSWKTLNLLPDANGFLPQAASTIEHGNQHVTVIESLQAYDEDIYETSKLLRETDRGVQAEYEESYQALPSRFAEAMGADIADATAFPNINAVVKACVDLKDYQTDYYMNNGVITKGLRTEAILRARPRSTSVHTDEEYTKELEGGSYPSGHGYAEWLVASCLAYINPQASTQLYKIAQDYGYSRVIIAAHWMTDINAGERLAAAAFPTLVSNSDFLSLLNEARFEYQDYVASHTYSRPQVTIADNFNWATKYASYVSSADATMIILRRYNGQHIDVTLGRTFKGGIWNTVCLPFSLETLEGTPFANAQVIAFADAQIQAAQDEGQELVFEFEQVTAMQAGVPYLVHVGDNDLVNPTFNNVLLIMQDPHVKRVNLDFTRDVTHNGITFHGVIKQQSVSPTNTLFLGDDNTLYHPSATGTMNGFRAYFEIPAAAANIPARITLRGNAGPATDIISVNAPSGALGAALAPAKVMHNGVVTITTGENDYLMNGNGLK